VRARARARERARERERERREGKGAAIDAQAMDKCPSQTQSSNAHNSVLQWPFDRCIIKLCVEPTAGSFNFIDSTRALIAILPQPEHTRTLTHTASINARIG